MRLHFFNSAVIANSKMDYSGKKIKCSRHSLWNGLFRDPLISLQSPSSGRDKNKNRGGFVDRQRRG